MRTYVKHVLAYENVSEQARKVFCVCDVSDWRTDIFQWEHFWDAHRPQTGPQIKPTTKNF